MNQHNYRHGGYGTRLYTCWRSMKDRCHNRNNPSYHRYGGRGIVVCNEWLDFIPFRDWARANGYQACLTIDRINNDGNYEPSNCRWISKSENVSKDAGKYGIKPVLKLGLDGVVCDSFSSISEAARVYGSHAEVISRVCRGKRKTAYGFKWKFLN